MRLFPKPNAPLIEAPPAAGVRLTQMANRLRATGERHLAATGRAFQAKQYAEAKLRLAAVDWGIDLLAIVDEVQVFPPDSLLEPPDRDGLAFHVGTMSLSTWHALLMPPEKELCLSGVAIDSDRCYLDQAIALKPSHASSVAFQPDSESIYQALKRFDSFGYSLRAFIHSHPGSGPDSTRPSGRDLETQRNLEGPYRCIGLIVNEEGYLRAFSVDLPFALSIHGKNVEVIDERQHLYRLHLS